jgi:hypothetical protein
MLSAQENRNVESKRFLDLVESRYVAAEGVGKQRLKLKFNLSPDLPSGAKITIFLAYEGLPIDGLKGAYEVQGRKRLGVVFDWELSKRIGPDNTYRIRVVMDLKDQTAAVLKAFEKKKKAFPPQDSPFQYTIYDGKEISIGTEAELAAQTELKCKLYDTRINELLDNWVNFNEAMTKLRAGEKFQKGGSTDKTLYARYIREWRRKQGKTQWGISVEFFEKYPSILSKSRTAHANLLRLGNMVSKRAYLLQKDVEKELSLRHENPVPDPKQKKDKDLHYFRHDYPYKKVTKETLNRTMDTIYRLVCPEEEGDPEGGTNGNTEAKPPEKKPTKKKPDSKKPVGVGKGGN